MPADDFIKVGVRLTVVDVVAPALPLGLTYDISKGTFVHFHRISEAICHGPTTVLNKIVGWHNYGLIGANILFCAGIAVSGAVHYYYQERAMFMVRGTLAVVVYHKTTELPLSVLLVGKDKQKASSGSLTLMCTDVERIRTGFLNIHEYCVNTMYLACWLLNRTLSSVVASAAPLVVILLAVLVMSSMAVLTGNRPRA